MERLTLFLSIEARSTNPKACCLLSALALLRNVALRIIFQFQSGRNTDIRIWGFGLPSGDWKVSSHGTLDTYQSLPPLLNMDIFGMIWTLDVLWSRWYATEFTEMKPRSSIIRDLISLWTSKTGVFDVEIFERSECHFLEWSVQQLQVDLVKDLIPLYTKFVARDGALHCGAVVDLVKSVYVHWPLHLGSGSKLSVLPWSESIIAAVIRQSGRSTSRWHIPQLDRDKLVRSLGMKNTK